MNLFHMTSSCNNGYWVEMVKTIYISKDVCSLNTI